MGLYNSELISPWGCNFWVGGLVYDIDLFRNMIETGDMTTFIDDVMVGTETEEEHDDIVEEILRRIAENDLFVKPEKYVWKVREIGFLEDVIGPDGVKIEKEKVQGVVD